MTGKRDLEDKRAASDPAGEEPKEDDGNKEEEEEEEEEPKTEQEPATKKAKTTDGDGENAEEQPPTTTKTTEESKPKTKEAPVKRENLSANALVVFGLHPLATKDEMNEVMSKYGKVERLETRKAFASTYCFCDYETAEQAQEAITKLNGTSLRGKELIVKLANDNTKRSKPSSG